MTPGLSSLTRTVYTGLSQIHLRESFLHAPLPLKLSHRTTYVLKRRVPIPFLKKHHNPNYVTNRLEPLYQEYICVQESEKTEYPPVKLVLADIVEDVGKRGQIVDVSNEMAYNLVLLNKALYATPENINKIKLLSESEIDKYSSLTAYKTMKMLKKKVLSLYMNMNEPWTIEPWHIRVNYRLAGVNILSDDCIELPDKPICGPNMDWEGKDIAVFLTINDCERFPVRCRLRHHTKVYSDRVILSPDHDCVPSEPILPEQKDLLDSIPLPEYIVEEKMS